MIKPTIGISTMAENLETKAAPKDTPAAPSSHQVGELKYSHRK